MKLKALVPTGHGINCELETRRALELSGFHEIDLVHLNFLVSGEPDVLGYHIIVFPGGFLDGDDLGAAQACANRIRHSRVNGGRLIDRLVQFVHKGGLILGICNGFQLLIKLGMLPASTGDYTRRDLTLAGNDMGRFEDRWVYLTIDTDSPCVYTKDVDHLYLPIRHGEGKIIGADPAVSAELVNSHQAVVRYALPDGKVTMDYPYNPNGSEQSIAGLCDPTGRVFGLMPHPEAYQDRTNHPRWTREELPDEGGGLIIFKNAATYIRNS